MGRVLLLMSQVLVKMHAAAVNPSDYSQWMGRVEPGAALGQRWFPAHHRPHTAISFYLSVVQTLPVP